MYNEEIKKLVKNACGNWYTKLFINEIQLKEDFVEKTSYVSCILEQRKGTGKEKNITIKGEGKGVVDALFLSITKEYQNKYISLKGIRLKEFSIKNIKNKKSETGTDVSVISEITVTNSRNKEIDFYCNSFSMNSAAIINVKETIEFFINAEIATLRIYSALKDANERHRADLIDKYTLELATLVSITSYEDLLKDK